MRKMRITRSRRKRSTRRRSREEVETRTSNVVGIFVSIRKGHDLSRA